MPVQIHLKKIHLALKKILLGSFVTEKVHSSAQILSEKLGDKCATIPFVICNLTVGAAEERELVVV